MTTIARIHKFKGLATRTLMDLPRLALAVLKTRTGKTMAVAVLAWASARLGLTWPQERIADVVGWLGLPIGSTTVSDLIGGGILAWGTVFANDRRQDLQKKAFPNRWYVPSSPHVPMSVRTRPFRFAGKTMPQIVEFYEIRAGRMYAVSVAGAAVEVDPGLNENHGVVYATIMEQGTLTQRSAQDEQ